MRKWRILGGFAAAALVGAGLGIGSDLVGTAAAAGQGSANRVQTGRHVPVNPVPASRMVVIQGVVTHLSGNWATVVTPPWRPYCPPGAMCPQFILAPVTYQVDVSQAVYENPSGMPTAGKLTIGERVVIAGVTPAHWPPMAPKNGKGSPAITRTMRAEIIEQAMARPIPPVEGGPHGAPGIQSSQGGGS